MYSQPASTRVTDSLISSSTESHEETTTSNCLYSLDGNNETYVRNFLESGLKEERFRIDRKKLEDMLQIQHSNGCGNVVENAEDFFQRVMNETSTQISWPSKLKIGAKSKKDPHVKIVGKPEAVQSAKEKILEILDTKKNRVTLKMDVSHSDHSYIIGKGGFKIQQVMEETGCHIHFPDSNRNSAVEKSNQVSIAGQAEGVEQARSKIRGLLPLVFMFELPPGVSVNPGDECSPAVQHIQQTYSFNVVFRSLGALGRILVIVRGCLRLLSRLRQGLILLMEYLTGSRTIPVMGFMKTEVAAQHHPFVMGICGANVQMIMSKTGASLTFPDQNSQMSSALDMKACVLQGHNVLQTKSVIHGMSSAADMKASVLQDHNVLQSKSTVIIQGSFDSVCLAWLELLRCLPLVLMFDLKEGQEIDTVLINHLMELYNISITVRPKMKENIKSVLVRGAEKDSRILFQVRREILGLQEMSFVYPSTLPAAETLSTPETFHTLPSVIPDVVSATPSTAAYRQIQASIHQEHFQANGLKSDVSSVGPTISGSSRSDYSTVEQLAALTNLIHHNPKILGLLNSLSSVLPVASQSCSPSYQPAVIDPSHYLQQSSNIQMRNSAMYDNAPAVNSISMATQGFWAKARTSTANCAEHNSQYEYQSFNNMQSTDSASTDDADSGIFLSRNSSRYGSSCGSRSDINTLLDSASSASSVSNESQAALTKDSCTDALKKAYSASKEMCSDVATLLAEYENKKIVASKVMHQEVGDNVRTPTTLWSGYGFSKSLPDFLHKGQSAQQSATYCKEDENSQLASAAWNTVNQDMNYVKEGNNLLEVPSPFSMSNIWEKIPQPSSTMGFSSIRTLDQLFNVFDLEKYTDIFHHHEIDIQTFVTLTDLDLQQLNIPYGARRKMLAAIAAMCEPKKNNWALNFRAAPGAERKGFSRFSSETTDQ